jgi:hypothetical protein
VQKPTLKTQTLSLVDRRTVITLIVVCLLFTLAWRGVGIEAAIDGIVFVAVALIGSNAAQRSLRAWAYVKRPKKPTKKETIE